MYHNIKQVRFASKRKRKHCTTRTVLLRHAEESHIMMYTRTVSHWLQHVTNGILVLIECFVIICMISNVAASLGPLIIYFDSFGKAKGQGRDPSSWLRWINQCIVCYYLLIQAVAASLLQAVYRLACPYLTVPCMVSCVRHRSLGLSFSLRGPAVIMSFLRFLIKATKAVYDDNTVTRWFQQQQLHASMRFKHQKSENNWVE